QLAHKIGVEIVGRCRKPEGKAWFPFHVAHPVLYCGMCVNDLSANEFLRRTAVAALLAKVMNHRVIVLLEAIPPGVKRRPRRIMVGMELKGITKAIRQSGCCHKTRQGLLKAALA